MPFPYISETKKLDASSRQSVDGNFILSDNGYTHYELSGNENAETVVLVHGFSVPNFIWDPTFRALTEAGYRVLRYDLFGRGFSDRPKTAYTLDLFANQLRDLLDALNITEPINLCGLSMGGPITAIFTARYPQRVKKLALFDPAGGKAIPHSLALKMLLIPGLGELLIGLFGDKILLKGLGTDFYDSTLLATFTAKYRPQMQYEGFKRALLSTMRGDTLGDSSALYRQVGELGIPTLLIWGEQDKTVPYEQAEGMLASLKRVRFHPVADSGHIPHYEKADEVNPILLDFLQN